MLLNVQAEDAILYMLHNNIQKATSDEIVVPLTGSNNKMQGQSLQLQMFETMTHMPKTHENSLHDARGFFCLFYLIINEGYLTHSLCL